MKSSKIIREGFGFIKKHWFKPALVILAAITLFPMYIMVKISISDPVDILTLHPPLLIQHVTTRHWKYILGMGGAIWEPLVMSLTVATLAVLLTLAICIPGAYAISRFPKKLRYPILLSIFFTRMFPEVGIALPISVMFIRWGLFDTALGLSLAHIIRILPIATWILVGTFEVIPPDLEKAASIDGCGKIGTLWHVVLPLALPGVSVAAIFAFLMSWDEFTYAIFLLLGRPTLPIRVYYYLFRGQMFHAATFSTLITIPVVIITLFLQKYLRSGILAGAVKG